jgi:hypothetical protein
MHTKYNHYAVLKNKLKMLEEEYAKEPNENRRKSLFWEIEKTHTKILNYRVQ